jgi:hypothetical protein
MARQMFKVRVSGFLCVTLFLTYASTAAAQELSLFGVHLHDHKDNYLTVPSRMITFPLGDLPCSYAQGRMVSVKFSSHL